MGAFRNEKSSQTGHMHHFAPSSVLHHHRIACDTNEYYIIPRNSRFGVLLRNGLAHVEAVMAMSAPGHRFLNAAFKTEKAASKIRYVGED